MSGNTPRCSTLHWSDNWKWRVNYWRAWWSKIIILLSTPACLITFMPTLLHWKKWPLALGHSLRKRYFVPALTTLVLGLELGLGLVYRSSCWFNLERRKNGLSVYFIRSHTAIRSAAAWSFKSLKGGDSTERFSYSTIAKLSACDERVTCY